MPKKFKRNCDFCHKYYEGDGKRFCSKPCDDDSRKTSVNDPDPTDTGLRSYEYVDGKFVFVVGQKVCAIEFDRWDEICRNYSRLGSDLSVAECARKHGLPREILARLFKAYGHFKSSPPNCRERIGEHKGDFAPLVAEAIENDEHRFIGQLERAREQEWREDYMRLKRESVVQDKIVAAAGELATKWPKLPALKLLKARSGEDYEAHIPTADEHAGKYNWADETFGEDLDTKETCARLRRHAEETVSWIRGQPGRCKAVHRSLVGDLFHALTGETEHGTKLDQDTRSAKVLMSTMEALVYGIGLLAGATDHVHVRGSKGNHDGFQFVFAMYLLKALCAPYKNVTVYVTPGYYASFRVGTTLHVLDHGYRMGAIGSWKAKAQAEVVAREVGKEDYHGCEQIITYVGHLHEEARSQHGGHLKLIRLESLGEPDDFETSLRYASQPAAHLFRLDQHGRISDERVLFRDRLSA